MDFLKTFDLDLDKEIYYAGETVTGRVMVENTENMRFNGIRLHIRGKAHAEWKITRAGERRTVRQDEHYIDERQLLWGKDHSDDSSKITIMPRGMHTFPLEFKLPETALPCSFESKYGTVRYYIRVTLDIPYASCPQGVKYFTVIGPHIDCMDERLLMPAQGVAKRNRCSLCCGKGPLLLRGMLERTGYCCGEHVRLKVEIQNGGDLEAWAKCQLVQHVEFFINKGVLGLSKEVTHVIVVAESERVAAHNSSTLHGLCERLQVPVCPPTMLEVCAVLQIYYTLELFLETEEEKEAAQISLPITIATLPFRIPNTPTPEILYEEPEETVEGGNYISSEFQLGQVYMGEEQDVEIDRTVIYRPVYVTVRPSRPPSACRSITSSRSNLLQVRQVSPAAADHSRGAILHGLLLRFARDSRSSLFVTSASELHEPSSGNDTDSLDDVFDTVFCHNPARVKVPPGSRLRNTSRSPEIPHALAANGSSYDSREELRDVSRLSRVRLGSSEDREEEEGSAARERAAGGTAGPGSKHLTHHHHHPHPAEPERVPLMARSSSPGAGGGGGEGGGGGSEALRLSRTATGAAAVGVTAAAAAATSPPDVSAYSAAPPRGSSSSVGQRLAGGQGSSPPPRPLSSASLTPALAWSERSGSE